MTRFILRWFKSSRFTSLNAMPLQKILQRDERAVAVPKSHMFDVRHERKLAAGDQFAEFARRADRRAAAAIDIVLREVAA